jgi:hypothetical protein
LIYGIETGIKPVSTKLFCCRGLRPFCSFLAHSRRIPSSIFPTTRLIVRPDIGEFMERGAYTFILDLPPRLEADVLRGRVPAHQLNIDVTAITQPGVGATYVDAIVQQEARNYLQSRGVETQLPVAAVIRAFFNPNLEGIRLTMAVLENVTMLSILLAGAAVIRERERGTIEHLLVMPIRASEIAAAKVFASGLVILVAAGLTLALVFVHVLKVPVAGSIGLFLAGPAVYSPPPQWGTAGPPLRTRWRNSRCWRSQCFSSSTCSGVGLSPRERPEPPRTGRRLIRQAAALLLAQSCGLCCRIPAIDHDRYTEPERI